MPNEDGKTSYFGYLNSFWNWQKFNHLAGNARLLYYCFLGLFNEAGWPAFIQVDNYRLMSMVDTRTERVAISARDKLVDFGFIKYDKGSKGSPNKYYLTKYTLQKVSEINSISVSVSGSVSVSETDSVSVSETDSVSVSPKCSHIKTKTKTKKKETVSVQGEHGRPKPQELPLDSPAYRAAVYLDEQLRARLPKKKPESQKHLQAWALEFERCHRIDGQSWEDIDQVLRFSQQDAFWSQNIMSGRKFREKFMQLMAKMNSQNSCQAYSEPRSYDIEQLAAQSVLDLPDEL